MPEIDGLTTTEKIREKERHTQSHLPIIAMTAYAMKGDRERCIEAGMDGYISKPINRRELEEAIASAVHVGNHTKPVTNHAPITQNAAKHSLWDAAQTLEQMGDDKKLLREVVEIFLVEGPKRIVGLQKAIAEENAIDLEQTAHSLKGELGYLGVSEALSKARKLEEMGRANDLQHGAEVFAALEMEIHEVLISMRGWISEAGMRPAVTPVGAEQ